MSHIKYLQHKKKEKIITDTSFELIIFYDLQDFGFELY